MSRSRPSRFARTGATVVLATLAACGIDQGGIERPPDLPELTVISGPITGFGSVHANGLVLDTSTAQIRVDGAPAVQADLRRGQIIRAIALVGPGADRALSIEHQSNLIGPIDGIDAAASSFTVLGQRVVANAATELDLGQSATFADLHLAEHVIVSGLRTPTGETLATYVGRAAAANTLRITGSITAADPSTLTFAIGGLSVDYSQVAMLQVPNGVPQAGAVVEVTGATQVGGTLVATQIRTPPFSADALAASATVLTPVAGAATTSSPRAANFMGFITTSTPGSIALADIDVTVGAGTAIIGGDIDGLQVGALVLVEGQIVGLGQINADRITIL